MRKKKGFTLAELLIVVAIIGVLVAISIPIFTSQMKKAREATNWANIRAAYAAAVADYIGLQSAPDQYTKYYHVDTGVLDGNAVTEQGLGLGASQVDALFEKEVVKQFEVTVKKVDGRDGEVEFTINPGDETSTWLSAAAHQTTETVPDFPDTGSGG